MASRPPGVTRRPALWCPDFPRDCSRGCLAHSAEILSDRIDEGELVLQAAGLFAREVEAAVHLDPAQLAADVTQVHAQLRVAGGGAEQFGHDQFG